MKSVTTIKYEIGCDGARINSVESGQAEQLDIAVAHWDETTDVVTLQVLDSAIEAQRAQNGKLFLQIDIWDKVQVLAAQSELELDYEMHNNVQVASADCGGDYVIIA